MYKITNIDTLGTDYTVADQNGKIIKSMQIIPHTDIVDAALGDYSPELFSSFSDYLERSIAVLSGFEKRGEYKTLWYATSDEEVVLVDVIEYALKNGYDRIILEHLENLQ